MADEEGGGGGGRPPGWRGIGGLGGIPRGGCIELCGIRGGGGSPGGGPIPWPGGGGLGGIPPGVGPGVAEEGARGMGGGGPGGTSFALGSILKEN